MAAGRLQRGATCADERQACGREDAWSWRPEAGAKPSGDDDPCGDGGYKPDTGESADISVKTIARGMPGVLG